LGGRVTGVWTQGLHLEPLHQPFFVKGFFEIGSWELFAWAGFGPQSSWSLPPEYLGLQVWAASAQVSHHFSPGHDCWSYHSHLKDQKNWRDCCNIAKSLSHYSNYPPPDFLLYQKKQIPICFSYNRWVNQGEEKHIFLGVLNEISYLIIKLYRLQQFNVLTIKIIVRISI
jgi:hypothetical protein